MIRVHQVWVHDMHTIAISIDLNEHPHLRGSDTLAETVHGYVDSLPNLGGAAIEMGTDFAVVYATGILNPDAILRFTQ